MEEGEDDYQKKMGEVIRRTRTCIHPQSPDFLAAALCRSCDDGGDGVFFRVERRREGRTPGPFGSMVLGPLIPSEFVGRKRSPLESFSWAGSANQQAEPLHAQG
jgi:hypothetical protein